ncbi:MAG TPA: response regulator transcription factor [Candidatus Coproplasma avicola]|uniref:Stage 0 sporulation protein A homolog n=1 Tax=Candidatus Coproplasma avicola TaxID=2840744 RepID=A0A9D1E7N4_9FIRM|nr:response regulator transcription factor [Candidatus Coproplasma avicola]
MKNKVFILEDDASICGLIRVALEMNNIAFEAFSCCADFIAAISKEEPDVALLDVMLPDGNGFDVLRQVKAEHPSVCCIMLSALGKEEDKVNGLNLGADDYVSKPFSVLELTARINAALRRKRQNNVLTVGDLALDYDSMSIAFKGKHMELNRKEYELLKYFIENSGKVLKRENLLNEIWGYENGETRTLDNHVARLRKMGVSIETVFGVGYKLNV